MPKLTDSLIKNAQATGKAYRLYDENGMYVQVSATCNKYFRLKFYFASKEQSPLALGVYPTTSLKEAHIKRDEARQFLLQGINPHDLKHENESTESSTFQFIAKEWISRQTDKSTIGFTYNRLVPKCITMK